MVKSFLELLALSYLFLSFLLCARLRSGLAKLRSSADQDNAEAQAEDRGRMVPVYIAPAPHPHWT